MELNVRNLTEKDYITLVKWWKEWGWDPVPQDMLPDNGAGGVMIQQGGKPIIAGFLFWSNSNIVWFDWIISDKNVSKLTRAKSLIYLIDVVEGMVKSAGKKYIITISDNKSLISTFKKKNWYVDKDPLNKIIKKI
tara:strand:- start:2255 stop:2659 length:405 start_codon:yes stop_codon:yes gene_type:complete